MNDERLERELRASLAVDEPGAPTEELRRRVAAIPDEAPVRRGRLASPWLRRAFLSAASLATVAIIVVVLGVAMNPRNVAVGPSATFPSGNPPPSLATPPSPPAAPTTAVQRDPSGIPTTLGGEPVHIGLAGVVYAASTTDATPFLVGGWFHDASVKFCSGGIGLDPSPLLRGCETVVGGNAPWTGGSPGAQGQMFWDGHALSDRLGPSIVRVHTHDSRAAQCRAANRTECRGVLVVDDVLWQGDDWTNARPLSVAAGVGTAAAVSIQTSFPFGPNGSLSVTRRLFATALETPCPSPWPRETFHLHGDPRFSVVAVFPDEATRAAAQASLDPSAPGCGSDPRVARIGAPLWVGVKNVLLLAYGDDTKAHVETTFGVGSGNPDQYLPLPPAGLDESYRVVDDREAARLAGILEAPNLTTDDSSAVIDAIRRFKANALSYSIGPGRPVTAADVGATVWATIRTSAVPGTARLFVVDHPNSTDPALARETVVSFELLNPGVDTWAFIVVPSGA